MKSGWRRKNYWLSAWNLPSGSFTHVHCSSWRPRSALLKAQSREAVSEWPREIRRKRERKASLLGGVTRSRRASPRPARGLFSFISHASTPQAANNQLTQLAMEHSPKTLPISTTSQEQRMPTKWRQQLPSPFPAYLLTTTHFRRRAHPAPQLASLPSRPGPGGGPSCWVAHARPWLPSLCRQAISLLIQVAKSVLFFHFRIFSPQLMF